MTMNDQVVSIGKICMDFIYGGMERLPALGEEIYSKGFTMQFGGGSPATLIHLKRLGVPHKLGLFLGKGNLSALAQRMLGDYGVCYENLYRGALADPLAITSVMSTKHDRAFASFEPDGGAYMNIPEGEMYELYRGARVAYIRLGYDDVWRRLKREGATLILDSYWTDELSFDMYREAFTYIDYFTPNEKEAPKIMGVQTPEEALDALAEYIPNPMVKLSRHGCIIKENGRTVHVPSTDNFVHVDSTGAGDAFIAGFIYGIYHGYSMRESTAFGNIMGGNCVTKHGCLAAEMDEKTLLAYYKTLYC